MTGECQSTLTEFPQSTALIRGEGRLKYNKMCWKLIFESKLTLIVIIIDIKFIIHYEMVQL